MNSARYRIYDRISYRVFEDFAVLLDHASHEVLRLNRAAGRVLQAIEAGDRPLTTDELAFAEELNRRGHVLRAEAETAEIVVGDAGEAAPGSGAVLERINLDAAAARIPLHCQLEVTYRCPLACRHCYVPPDAADTARELSLDEIGSFLDQLAELGGLFLLLTGGEPFARSDLVQIFELARDRRFAVSLLTSGVGAEARTLERLAERGIDSLQVSLHGPDPASHDRLTGVAGSFDTALQCLRTCRDLGIRVRAGITVNRENAGTLGEIKALLAGEDVPAALGLHIEPRRDGDRGVQALAIDETGVRAALETFPPKDAPRLRDRELDDPPCGAGANVLAVDPFGGVYPCLSLRQRVGALREQQLARIWRESPALDQLRRLRVADLEQCPTCEHRRSCNRCTGLAVSEERGLKGHAPLDCIQARVLTFLEGLEKTPKG